MHTVTNPSSASTHNDIALMEAVAGFFGRLEFMTLGEAAFTKTSEFARQARRIVAKAVDQNQNGRRDSPSERRPGITVYDANDGLGCLPDLPISLELTPTNWTAPDKQHVSGHIRPRGTDFIVHDAGTECDPPDFGGIFPSLRSNNPMNDSMDLLFDDLPDGYW